MTVIVIEQPSPVLTLEEAKWHLRVDHADDDAFIEGLVASATAWLDGPGGWLGRALGGQVLEWQLNAWPCSGDIVLPFPPAVEVISVKYFDPNGVEQSWAFPTPLYFEDMPAVRGRASDIKIRYRAGYGAFDTEDPPAWQNAVPKPIKLAITMLVAQWYETREASTIGSKAEQLPFAVEALLSTYRVYR